MESVESIRNPGGIQVEIDKNLAGLPAKEIPGGMTRNLWGSVKSSQKVTGFRTVLEEFLPLYG